MDNKPYQLVLTDEELKCRVSNFDYVTVTNDGQVDIVMPMIPTRIEAVNEFLKDNDLKIRLRSTVNYVL